MIPSIKIGLIGIGHIAEHQMNALKNLKHFSLNNI